ncbi:Protein of unknown function [Caldanaerobius fijiensis DSM 17918]|uniref:DUF4446 domain-containing protein n=1 Tax=Caldanaerobius fijiensis DSM 17918 TaxID=1121256 RepID=A0A1M5AQH1_9THEO|nr:DUF4446 family protein [Caldanaerobius fijiensis]SHF32425.1 Protein of unknown function [Caldanaerobius fijiensis DSM 17918]
MDVLKLLGSLHLSVVSGIIIVLLFILLFLYISLFIKLGKLKRRIDVFMKGENGVNIEKLLKSYMSEVETALMKVNDFQKQMDEIVRKLEMSIKKVAIVRYNAFDEVGSDLSFSIALLDDHDDGVVITGIYGRNETTTYAKPIKNGMSNYKLSAEELEVIDKARKKFI